VCAKFGAVAMMAATTALMSPYAGVANVATIIFRGAGTNVARGDLCRFCDAILRLLNVRTPHMFSSCNIPGRQHADLAGIAYRHFATDRKTGNASVVIDDAHSAFASHKN